MEDDNVDQPGFAGNALCDVRRNRIRGFARTIPKLARCSHIAAWRNSPALFLTAILIGVVAGGAGASARDYGLVAMNFDLWCQEAAHLPAERCDSRTAADEKAFEEFQQDLSPYEAQNLRQAQQEQWLDRDFLDNDPIDNPSLRNPATPAQIPLPRRVDRQ